MAKTVVGLFDNASDAQNVLSDLQSIGFGSSDAELITQSAFSGSESDVVDRLTSEGVPSDDARLYFDGVRNGGALVVARTDDTQVNEVVSVMNRHNIVDLDSRRGSYSQVDTDRSSFSTSTTGTTDTSYTGTTGTSYTDTTRSADYGTTTGSRSTVDAAENVAVPIVEEELRVGKRETERGGVRVDTRVEETPVEEQVTLRDETVRVERRPASGTTSAADLNAFQEGTFEVRETDEEAIVDKQARVVEEVVISKDVDQRTETISDTVRRTDVDVQEVGGGRTSSTTGTTGTTDANYGGRDRTLTDRVEGATGLDIDRDSDVDGRRNV